MKKNMGNIDRALRILIAAVIVGLFLGNVIGGTLAVIGLIVSGIFILTSFAGTCPLYIPLKISTAKKETKE